jgi:hypothetical protein
MQNKIYDLKDRIAHNLQTHFLISDTDAKRIVRKLLNVTDEHGMSINRLDGELSYISLKDWDYIMDNEGLLNVKK